MTFHFKFEFVMFGLAAAGIQKVSRKQERSPKETKRLKWKIQDNISC